MLQDFLEHFSPSQEDPYLSPGQDFKLIAYLVQELWCCKVEVANCDTAVVAVGEVAAGHWLSKVRI